MNNYKIFIILIIVALITITSVFTFFNLYNVLRVEDFPVKYEVIPNVVGSGAFEEQNLFYGIISPGSSARKEINIENNFDFPIELQIYPEGNATQFMTVTNDEYIVTLEPGESRLIHFSVYPPFDTPEGIYEGNVRIKFLRS